MKRKLDRLSVLEHVADALHVPVHVLLDDEAFQRNAGCVDPVEVAALRSALLEHRMAVPRTQPGAPPEPGTPRDPIPAEVAALQAQLRYAWSAFQASDYATLGPLLGRMLTAAHATATSGSDDGRQVTALLSEIYQVIASTTRKLGYVELEWVAAERSQVLAEQTDDPVLRGGAAFRLVNAMKDNNGAAAAVHSAQRAADDLASGGDASRPEVRSLFGHTLLQGAMAAAAADDSAGARAFLTDARGTAASLGVDRNDYYTAFGPTNVTIHEVAAMVELREWTTALKAVSAMDAAQLARLPRERRANHLLEIARAYSLAGRRDQATDALLDADAVAPREIRCRPAAKDLIADLIRRSPAHPSPDLTRLAQRAGVTA